MAFTAFNFQRLSNIWDTSIKPLNPNAPNTPNKRNFGIHLTNLYNDLCDLNQVMNPSLDSDQYKHVNNPTSRQMPQSNSNPI